MVNADMQKASQAQRDGNQFRTFLRRNVRERSREKNNWRLYDGTEYGQWSEDALRILVQEGRPPSTFNFTKRYVDTTAGSVIADAPDIHFETELGESNDIAIALEEKYIEDREVGNFLHEYLQFIRSGFVYRGWLEIYTNRENDPRGQVAFRYRSGDQVVTDPDWTTHRVNDNKALFLWSWMSAQQIKDTYKKTSAEIENAIERRKLLGGDSGDSKEIDKLYDTSPEFYDTLNDQYLVFDKLELVTSHKARLFDVDTASFLPDMDGEERDAFIETSVALGKNIEVIKSSEKICMVKTTCPALGYDLGLQNGRHGMQVGGYPLFTFSSDCINGRPNTPVDQLRDPQVNFNKRESTITHILSTTNNNALMIETDAVDDPKDIETIGKGRNRPGAYFEVAPGAVSGNKIRMMDKNPPPNNFMDAAQHIWTIAKEITPAVPSVQGIGETGESGVLFQAKVAQAQVGMMIPTKFLKAAWQTIGEAYFHGFKQTYTYPLVFTSTKSKKQIALNMPGGIDVKSIPRMRISIQQSKSSETFRRAMLQQFVSIAQYIPGPLTKQSLSTLMVSQLPNIPDDDRESLTENSRLEEELQKMLVMSQMAQAKSQLAPPTAPPKPGQPAQPDMHPSGIPNSIAALLDASKTGQQTAPSAPPQMPIAATG